MELCCVIGVPDEERINYPEAHIVLKSEFQSDKAIDEILEICRQNLPGYMVPEEIVIEKELPRTSRGKVDYRVLEREHREK